MKKLLTILFVFLIGLSKGQEDNFPYELEFVPVSLSGFPGLHSFAFGQHEGKWLIIGGRLDGIHARQAFAAFPESANNREIFVIDIQASKLWKASVDGLPVNLKEQLQSTNMNFYQDGKTLIISGGYGFSSSRNQHITYPFLTVLDVEKVIDAIIQGKEIRELFIQIPDERMAVTGGQLGKIGEKYMLVGGHRFDGRYNPFGNPTFTQTYTNQIRKFKLSPSQESLVIGDYETLTDPIHLRRRDYNLIPQIFPDGKSGYTISSGVFQPNVDLPYLYPVDITEEGISPKTGFNQYLSNYHSGKISLYDEEKRLMHTLFLGGISQYYYQNGQLIKDDLVPFVKTISRLTRFPDNNFKEFLMASEMPGLKGASAEFIPNQNLPHFPNEIIKLSAIEGDEIILGHLLGGIDSNIINPFSSNQTNQTTAGNIFLVKLRKSLITGIGPLDGANPYEVIVYPVPYIDQVKLKYFVHTTEPVAYFLSNDSGQIIKEGTWKNEKIGWIEHILELKNIGSNPLMLTLVFEGRFTVTKKIFK